MSYDDIRDDYDSERESYYHRVYNQDLISDDDLWNYLRVIEDEDLDTE